MGARANVYVGGDCHKGARRLQRIIRETGEKSKYKENLCGYTGRVCVTMPSSVESMPHFDRRRCLKLYESAIEADSWGQLEEALEAYAKLVGELTDTVRYAPIISQHLLLALKNLT